MPPLLSISLMNWGREFLERCQRLRAPNRIRRLQGQRPTRSRSTGDLESPQYELVPLGLQPLRRLAAPLPTQPLPPHPDDRDRVPVDFGEPSTSQHPRLMNPHSAEARELMEHGSSDIRANAAHLIQPWFYQHMPRARAEGILAGLGLRNGSFIVRNTSRIRKGGAIYAISLAHDGRVLNFLVFRRMDLYNRLMYFIESNRQFRTLNDLVSYYRRNEGSLLPCPLEMAVGRIMHVDGVATPVVHEPTEEEIEAIDREEREELERKRRKKKNVLGMIGDTMNKILNDLKNWRRKDGDGDGGSRGGTPKGLGMVNCMFMVL